MSLQYVAMSHTICMLTASRSLLWMVCVALLAIGWSSFAYERRAMPCCEQMLDRSGRAATYSKSMKMAAAPACSRSCSGLGDLDGVDIGGAVPQAVDITRPGRRS